jgi:hypothetical protein
MSKNFKPVLIAFFVALTVYILNKSYFLIFNSEPKEGGFKFLLEIMYIFFFVFSAIIIFIMNLAKKISPENVGFIFMFITTLKVGISYFIFSSIISSENTNIVGRINFFIVFIVFLAIEAVFAIILLNKNQKSDS